MPNYFYEKDFDLVKFDEEQKKAAKREGLEKQRKLLRIAKRAGKDDEGAMDGIVTQGMRVRQTFAIPFHIQCLHCNQRIARGVHVYMNRYIAQGDGESKTDLGLKVWEIQFRCTHCSKHVYIRTDNDTPDKTGGYIAHKYCKRIVGDFLDIYKKEAAKVEEDKLANAKVMATMSDAERRGIENKARQEAQEKLEAMLKSRNNVTAADLLDRLEAEDSQNFAGTSSSLLDAIGSGDGVNEDDDDALMFLGDEEFDDEDEGARSESDVEDNEAVAATSASVAIGHKRVREETDTYVNGVSDAKTEQRSARTETFAKEVPLVVLPASLMSNDFLSSLFAVLGTSLNLSNVGATAAPAFSAPAAAPATTTTIAVVPAAAPIVTPNAEVTTTSTVVQANDPLSIGGTIAGSSKKKAGPKLKGTALLNSYFS